MVITRVTLLVPAHGEKCQEIGEGLEEEITTSRTQNPSNIKNTAGHSFLFKWQEAMTPHVADRLVKVNNS